MSTKCPNSSIFTTQKPLTSYLSPHPYPKEEIDEESLPIRVIDIDQTLTEANNGHIYFLQPNNWDFHIISHTWSQHIRKLSKAVGDKLKENKEVDSNGEEANDDAFKKYTKAFHIISHTWKQHIRKLSKAVGDKLKQNKEVDSNGEEANHDAFKQYTKAFQEQDWTKSEETVKAYLAIKEFMQILHREGVKSVWLDAICINQHSEEEKDREVPRMASYYKYSRACFVPINGFGFGEESTPPIDYSNGVSDSIAERYSKQPGGVSKWRYQGPSEYITLRKREGEGMNWQEKQVRILPDQVCEGGGGGNDYWWRSWCPLLKMRWFKRVWTLQEWLFPKNVYFILQMENWMENILLTIAEMTKATHFCNRIQHAMDSYANTGSFEDYVQNVVDRIFDFLKEDSAWSTSNFEDCHVCKDYGHMPLLKRVDQEGKNQPRHYFVNSSLLLLGLRQLSDAYFLDFYDPNNEYYRELSDEGVNLYWVLRDKDRPLKQETNSEALVVHLWTLVQEIRKRKCDEKKHPQDRILGILGLLGLSDNNSVKITASVKKTPEEQLVELARQNVLSNDLLLQLCFMDPYGGNKPGMSWIPDFTTTAKQNMEQGHNSLQFLDILSVARYIALVKGVSEGGAITLQCAVFRAKARLERRNRLEMKEITDVGNSPERDLCIRWTFSCSGWKFMFYRDTDDDDGFFRCSLPSGCSGYMYLPIKDMYTCDLHLGFEACVLPVFMLDYSEETYCVVMFCLSDGTAGSPLHKLGRALILMDKEDRDLPRFWKAVEENIEEVTIGGFGDDIEKDLEHVLSKNYLYINSSSSCDP